MKCFRGNGALLVLISVIGVWWVTGGVAHAMTLNADPTLLEGLVSYWPLDEESGVREDVVGNNHLNSFNNVSFVDGIIGNTAVFDMNSMQRLATNTNAGITNGAITWSFWVMLTKDIQDSDNILMVFVSKSDAETGVEYDVRYHSESGTGKIIYYRAMPGVTGNQVNHPIQLEDGWHHIVMSYDGEYITGYHNGVDVGSVRSVGDAVIKYPSNLAIGSRWPADYHATSLIDEVGLWNRALTADEVLRLYNAGAGLPFAATVEPPEPPVLTSATTSIAFLPGIMGSRLYRPRPFGIGEDKLWESILMADIADFNMKSDGTSVRSDIYTRDVIDYALKVTGSWSLGGEGYANFLTYLDTLKGQQIIHDWKALPYDWRLTLELIRTQGSEDEDGNVSYLTSTTTPYLLQEIKRLADESPSGMVTIVAHSNGGIVAKHLLKTLEDQNDPLYKKINLVVLVGSPQLGTPKAIGELLHGTIPVVTTTVREVSEHMPGAHQLLPSRAYFSNRTEPIALFDSSVGAIKKYAALAGTSVTTYEGMRSLMQGWDGLWSNPNILDTITPNVLSATLLDRAQETHDQLDSWIPNNDGPRMVQVAAVGVDTPDRIRYYDRCIKQERTRRSCPSLLMHEYGMSRRGDGTVMGGSANGAPDVTSYYVEFDAYNRDSESNYRHMNILSALPVRALLVQELTKKTSILPEYVTEEAQVSDTTLRYRFRVYSPLDIHLFDAEGRHTGVTEGDGGDLGRRYEERIPNSYYLEWGEVTYAGVDGETGPVRVSLAGTGQGTFRLEIDAVVGDEVTHTYTFADVPVTASASGTVLLVRDEAPTLVYDLDGNGTVDAQLVSDGGVTVPGYTLYLAALRAHAQQSGLPAWLRATIAARLTIIERQVAHGSKGNIVAARVLIETIRGSVRLHTPKIISRTDAEVWYVYLNALRDSIAQ